MPMPSEDAPSIAASVLGGAQCANAAHFEMVAAAAVDAPEVLQACTRLYTGAHPRALQLAHLIAQDRAGLRESAEIVDVIEMVAHAE